MNSAIIYITLLLVGLCMGSFAGATVWRLRARQLEQDKASGEKINNSEYKQLQTLATANIMSDRSQCLKCGYRLKWYDLIPVISWLSLGGECRKCHRPIGVQELLIEVFMAAFFVVSYTFWPFDLSNGFEIARFIIWLMSGVGLGILFTYDKLWSLLPDKVNYAVIGLGVGNAFLVILNSTDKTVTVTNIIGSVLILSGIYLIIYLISVGRWVGFGDVKLGLGLALLLADWQLAFIALFTANLIGCLIVIPAIALGKLKRDSRVPFGPLLIAGYLIAVLAGNYLLSIYFLILL